MSRHSTYDGLPHFLVIGAEKSGTTWLYNALRRHPDVYVPETKEVHFFNAYNSLLQPVKHYELGIEWYRRFFRKAQPDQIIGEVTPMYLCDPLAIKRIRDTLPQARLIYILREPGSRAYSHYWMAKRKRLLSKDFSELVAAQDARFIGRGFYAEQVQRLYELFAPEQLLGLSFEELFEDRHRGLSKVLDFLKVSSDSSMVDAVLDRSAKNAGAAAKPRSVLLYKLTSRIVQFLRNSHRGSEIMDFVKGTRLSQWLKSANLRRIPYEPMTVKDCRALHEIYESDIMRLAELVEFSVEHWLEKQLCTDQARNS